MKLPRDFLLFIAGPHQIGNIIGHPKGPFHLSAAIQPSVLGTGHPGILPVIPFFMLNLIINTFPGIHDFPLHLTGHLGMILMKEITIALPN